MSTRPGPDEAPMRLRESGDALGRVVAQAAQSLKKAEQPHSLARARVWRTLSSKLWVELSGELRVEPSGELSQPKKYSWLASRFSATQRAFAAGVACAVMVALALFFTFRPSVQTSSARDPLSSANVASRDRDRWQQLAQLYGEVHLESEGKTTAAAEGQALAPHARIRVGPEGAALLSLGEVRIALAPGAVLRLDPTVTLEEGRAAIFAPSAATVTSRRFKMAAGSSLIEASGGLFLASVTAERAELHSESAQIRVSVRVHDPPYQGDRAANPELAAIAPGESWSASPNAERASPDRASVERSSAERASAERSSAKEATNVSNTLDAASLRPLVELAAPASAQPAESIHSALRRVALLAPNANASARQGRDRDARDLGDLHVHVHDPGEELQQLAQEAEGEARYAEAASLYQQLAGLGDAREPTALYELARLRLRFLGEPAQALVALDQERAQFARSPIAQEVALTAVEARLALRDDAATLREMTSFLDQFEGSERAGEVRWLRASLLLQEGSCGAAKSDLEALTADTKPDATSDGRIESEALFALATCARRERDGAGERASLEEYLRRFPHGAHQREAKLALESVAPRSAPGSTPSSTHRPTPPREP